MKRTHGGTELIFNLKTEGSLDHLLGNDYRQKEKGMWATSSKKCTQRALFKIEDVHGTIAPASSPSLEGDHLERDLTPLLNEHGYR